MPTVIASAKGQIVIPKKEREKVGIKPGLRVVVQAVGDHIEIRPLPENPVDYFCGIFKGGPSLTRALLQDRQEEMNRENKTGIKFRSYQSQGRHRHCPRRYTRYGIRCL